MASSSQSRKFRASVVCGKAKPSMRYPIEVLKTQLDLSMMQAWSLPHRRQLPVMRLTLSSMRNQLGIFPTSCPWLSSPSWSPKSYLECAHDEQNFDSTNVKARPVHMWLRSFPHGTRGFFQKPVVAAASGLEGGISLSNSAISDA